MHGEVTSKSQLGFKLSDSSTFILNSWLDKTKYKFQTAWIYQLPKSVFTLYIKSNYLSVPVLDNAESLFLTEFSNPYLHTDHRSPACTFLYRIYVSKLDRFSSQKSLQHSNISLSKSQF